MYDENVICIEPTETVLLFMTSMVSKIAAAFPNSIVVENTVYFDSSKKYGIQFLNTGASSYISISAINDSTTIGQMSNVLTWSNTTSVQIRWRKSKNQSSFYLSWWLVTSNNNATLKYSYVVASQLNSQVSVYCISTTTCYSMHHGSGVYLNESAPTSNANFQYPILFQAANPFDGSELVDLRVFKYINCAYPTGSLLQSGNNIYSVIGGGGVPFLALRIA